MTTIEKSSFIQKVQRDSKLERKGRNTIINQQTAEQRRSYMNSVQENYGIEYLEMVSPDAASKRLASKSKGEMNQNYEVTIFKQREVDRRIMSNRLRLLAFKDNVWEFNHNDLKRTEHTFDPLR